MPIDDQDVKTIADINFDLSTIANSLPALLTEPAAQEPLLKLYKTKLNQVRDELHEKAQARLEDYGETADARDQVIFAVEQALQDFGRLKLMLDYKTRVAPADEATAKMADALEQDYVSLVGQSTWKLKEKARHLVLPELQTIHDALARHDHLPKLIDLADLKTSLEIAHKALAELDRENLEDRQRTDELVTARENARRVRHSYRRFLHSVLILSDRELRLAELSRPS